MEGPPDIAVNRPIKSTGLHHLNLLEVNVLVYRQGCQQKDEKFNFHHAEVINESITIGKCW